MASPGDKPFISSALLEPTVSTHVCHCFCEQPTPKLEKERPVIAPPLFQNRHEEEKGFFLLLGTGGREADDLPFSELSPALLGPLFSTVSCKADVPQASKNKLGRKPLVCIRWY
jgi:hypothetical protein